MHRRPPPPAAPGAGASHTSAPSTADWRAALVQFYQVHNPAKLADVDRILQEFRGREDELFQALHARYDPPHEPPAPRLTFAEAICRTVVDGATPRARMPPPPPTPPQARGPAPQQPLPRGIRKRLLRLRAERPQADDQELLAVATAEQEGWRTAIARFYQAYAPEKLADLPQIFAECEGEEESLYDLLEMKYLPEANDAVDVPPPPEAAAVAAVPLPLSMFQDDEDDDAAAREVHVAGARVTQVQVALPGGPPERHHSASGTATAVATQPMDAPPPPPPPLQQHASRASLHSNAVSVNIAHAHPHAHRTGSTSMSMSTYTDVPGDPEVQQPPPSLSDAGAALASIAGSTAAAAPVQPQSTVSCNGGASAPQSRSQSQAISQATSQALSQSQLLANGTSHPTTQVPVSASSLCSASTAGPAAAAAPPAPPPASVGAATTFVVSPDAPSLAYPSVAPPVEAVATRAASMSISPPPPMARVSDRSPASLPPPPASIAAEGSVSVASRGVSAVGSAHDPEGPEGPTPAASVRSPTAYESIASAAAVDLAAAAAAAAAGGGTFLTTNTSHASDLGGVVNATFPQGFPPPPPPRAVASGAMVGENLQQQQQQQRQQPSTAAPPTRDSLAAVPSRPQPADPPTAPDRGPAVAAAVTSPSNTPHSPPPSCSSYRGGISVNVAMPAPQQPQPQPQHDQGAFSPTNSVCYARTETGGTGVAARHAASGTEPCSNTDPTLSSGGASALHAMDPMAPHSPRNSLNFADPALNAMLGVPARGGGEVVASMPHSTAISVGGAASTSTAASACAALDDTVRRTASNHQPPPLQGVKTPPAFAARSAPVAGQLGSQLHVMPPTQLPIDPPSEVPSEPFYSCVSFGGGGGGSVPGGHEVYSHAAATASTVRGGAGGAGYSRHHHHHYPNHAGAADGGGVAYGVVQQQGGVRIGAGGVVSPTPVPTGVLTPPGAGAMVVHPQSVPPPRPAPTADRSVQVGTHRGIAVSNAPLTQSMQITAGEIIALDDIPDQLEWSILVMLEQVERIKSIVTSGVVAPTVEAATMDRLGGIKTDAVALRAIMAAEFADATDDNDASGGAVAVGGGATAATPEACIRAAAAAATTLATPVPVPLPASPPLPLPGAVGATACASATSAHAMYPIDVHSPTSISPPHSPPPAHRVATQAVFVPELASPPQGRDGGGGVARTAPAAAVRPAAILQALDALRKKGVALPSAHILRNTVASPPPTYPQMQTQL